MSQVLKKILLLSCISAFPAALGFPVSLAGLACAANAADPFDPIRYSHVVVEGEVRSVEKKIVTLGDLGYRTLTPDMKTPVFMVTLAHARSHRGPASVQTVGINLPVVAGEWIGKTLILCGDWKHGLSGYFVLAKSGVFVKDRDDWVCLQDNKRLSAEEIDLRLGSVSLTAVSRQAELIVVGTVIAQTDSTVPSDVGSSVQVQVITLSIEDVIKGTKQAQVVSFVKYLAGPIPTWYARDVSFGPGERWLVFLASDSGSYHPVQGRNGSFLVKGEDLYYDRVQLYGLSRSSLRSKVKQVIRE